MSNIDETRRLLRELDETVLALRLDVQAAWLECRIAEAKRERREEQRSA